MRKVINKFYSVMFALLASLSLLVAGTGAHASAMAVHSPGSMHEQHTISRSIACANLCMSATVDTRPTLTQDTEEDDDDPSKTTFQPLQIHRRTNERFPENALVYSVQKIPLHKLYEVYRI